LAIAEFARIQDNSTVGTLASSATVQVTTISCPRHLRRFGDPLPNACVYDTSPGSLANPLGSATTHAYLTVNHPREFCAADHRRGPPASADRIIACGTISRPGRFARLNAASCIRSTNPPETRSRTRITPARVLFIHRELLSINSC
jgi:hypothetical protein